MRRLSLYAKIGIVVAGLIGAKIAISAIAITQMEGINTSLANITGTLVPQMSDGFALRDLVRRLASAERSMVSETNRAGVEARVKELGELGHVMTTNLDSAYRTGSPKSKEALRAAKGHFEKWLEADVEIQAQALAGQMAAAAALVDQKSQPLMHELLTQITQVVDGNKNNMDEQTAYVEQELTQARAALITFVTAMVAFGAIVAFLIMTSLARSINQVIDRLNGNTGLVTKAAQRIATSSNELSTSTREQAASLGHTTTQVREMSDAVKGNAQSAQMACELSQQSVMAATKGKDVVAEMIAAITEINSTNQYIMTQIAESNEQMTRIAKVVAEISEKTSVVNDIAFQTKLLSFNASVEAAKAGEHGKGFAVVAEEVRNLAQMSGNAALDIGVMLDSSVQQVEAIVKDTNERVARLVQAGTSKVEAGTRIAEQCGKVLDEIVVNVGSVNKMALDIAGASEAQALGIEKVFETVRKLDKVTQANATVSVDAAAVGTELSEDAEALRSTVGLLVETIRGGNRNTASIVKTEAAPPAAPVEISEPSVSKAPGVAGPPSNVVELPIERAQAGEEGNLVRTGNQSSRRG